MTDTADQLAAAIRQIIDDAVRAALRPQQVPARLPPDPPKPVDEPPPARVLYPLKEIQQMLGLSRTTVYQLLSDGQLPSVTIGRRRFVTAGALNAYVEGIGWTSRP
jgi:excisionase family DNA binding protein